MKSNERYRGTANLRAAVTAFGYWCAAFVLASALPVGAAAQQQTDSISYKELQSKYLRLGNELDSLRSLLLTHGSTLFYLNQSDSAGLWENPYVQKQIDKELQLVDSQYATRTTTFLIGMIAFGVGLISLYVFMRLQFARRFAELEARFETLRKDTASGDHQHTLRCLEHREKQLQEMNDHRAPSFGTSFDEIIGVDHSFPLRVADEMHRMRKRIQFMPEDSQAAKALSNSLRRIEEELNSGGYEVVELLGKKYVDGLNVEARFVPAEDKSIEGEIITDVVRPQVNYMGVMIQQAKVEVSKSYS